MPTDDKADQPITRGDLDRAVDFIVGELTRLHGELALMHGEIKSRDDNNGRRLDRMSETLRTMDSRLSAMTKWSDTLDRDNAR